MLIPSTWNNLDELNPLITFQIRRARPSPTTGFSALLKRPPAGFVSHGAVEDEVHPAAESASGPGPVAAVLAGSDVWDLHLLSGCLPQDRAAPEG